MSPGNPFSKSGCLQPAAPPPWIGPKATIGSILLCSLAAFRLGAGEATAPPQDQTPIKFCLSSKLFREVNENDARASMKVYARQIAESHGYVADPNPIVFGGTAELTELLRSGKVDVVSMPTREYLALEENLVSGPLLVALINGSDYEEYVLLVRDDSGVRALSELKGRSIMLLDSLQGSLVGLWLEALLQDQKLAPPETFFKRVVPVIKTSQTLLPVFFRQCDACVVTRGGFALMGELNPQVTKQLRVLASSQQLVPHLTCFRAGLDPSLKARVAAAVTEAHASAAGKQMMTIFQCDRIEERPPSKLQPTRELLASCAAQRRKSDGPETAQQTPSSTQPGGGGP